MAIEWTVNHGFTTHTHAQCSTYAWYSNSMSCVPITHCIESLSEKNRMRGKSQTNARTQPSKNVSVQ